MADPVFMTDHTLDALKNSVTNEHHLDYTAKLSSAVTIDPLYAGRVVYLHTDGTFKTGLPDVNLAGHMPMFLWQSSNDPDVANPGGSTRAGGWYAAAPTGVLKALVAVGGWELESTEFAAGSYAPGDCLTAANADTTAATGGVLVECAAYAAPVCGVVSRGVRTNAHGVSTLCFWPVWLPRHDVS